jgi:hypothetical protein
MILVEVVAAAAAAVVDEVGVIVVGRVVEGGATVVAATSITKCMTCMTHCGTVTHPSPPTCRNTTTRSRDYHHRPAHAYGGSRGDL